MTVTQHGLDAAQPPNAVKARAMLQEIGGTWWNVYIGGPEAQRAWTPAEVQEYEQEGISQFLLCYVGRQSGEVSRLTVAQGEQDGHDACQLAGEFGMAAAGTPICLDLELRTFEAAPSASLDYVGAWCQTVRARGLRPGVYANPSALKSLHERAVRPDWIWIASWVQHGVNPGADPHQAADVPPDIWPKQGQRAWQYAGAFNQKACQVGDVDVDIDVADEACLARRGGHPGWPHPSGHTYTVQPGDTLSAIARKLNIAGGWQELYALNRGIIGPNPGLIHPGQALQLP
ncbi:MAG TPA: glycoside hydrolase domain-containing protein [Streptosporangiaceae bacterium]